MPPEAEALVRKYYTYAGLYTLAASIIWGINTLFLLNAGLSISQVFIANAAFSFGTLIFEIPTGVVADTIGRRASFLLSIIVLAASTLAYVWLAQIGAGIVAFAVVSALIGLGFTFYSGAMDAWLVDGVRELGFSGDLDGVFANAQIISGVAMLFGTIGGGLLGQINLAIPFVVRAVVLIILGGLAFTGMHDIGFETRKVTWKSLPSEARSVASAGIKHGWNSRPLRMIMLGSALQSGFFIFSWYAWQPYFLDLLERDAVWVAGVVAAVLALAMIAGNSLVKYVSRFCGRRTTLLLFAAVTFSVASIGVGLATSFPVALGFLMASSVAIGVQGPVRQTFIHGIAPTQQRATVLSFDAMLSGGAGVIGQTALGGYAEDQGYGPAYVVGGAFVILATPFILAARRMKSSADYFGGNRGGSDVGDVTPDSDTESFPASDSGRGD